MAALTVSDLSISNTITVTPSDDLTATLQGVGSNTAVELADGTHTLDDAVDFSGDDYAVVAASGADPVIDVTVSASSLGDSTVLFNHTGGRFVFGGFTLDYSGGGIGGRTQVYADAAYTVRDIVITGANDGSFCFRFDVRNSGATAHADRLVMRDGSDGTGGILVGLEHAGELFIRDCEVEGFMNNGLYASAPAKPDGGGNGTVKIEGGLYANNNVASVRLGGAGSYVDGAKVIVDDDVPPNSKGNTNARGIRFDEAGGAEARNCELLITASEGLGAIVWSGTAGASTVRDTRIKVDTDQFDAGINARNGDSGGATLSNVAITGSTSSPAIKLEDRTNSAVTGCCLSSDGDGVLVKGGDASVDNLTESVGGRAIVSADGADVDEGTVTPGTCPVPDLSGSSDASGGSPNTYQGITFGTIVDAVADLGVDDTGNNPINSTIANRLDDGDVLITFPPGQYLVDDSLGAFTESKIGLAGTGSSWDDVEFIPESGYNDTFIELNGNQQLLENFTLAVRDDEVSDLRIRVDAPGRIEIADVKKEGFIPGGNGCGFIPTRLGPDGVANYNRIARVGPTSWLEYPENPVTIMIPYSNEGEVNIDGYYCEHAGESAIYAGKSAGPVRVKNFVGVNNVHTSLRVNDTGDGESLIENAIIIMDETQLPAECKGSPNQMRGIWYQNNYSKAGRRYAAETRNVEIYLNTVPKSVGCIVCNPDTGGGPLTNITLTNNDDDWRTVQVSNRWRDFEFSDLHISGSSTDSIIRATGDAGVRVSDACISQPGEITGDVTIASEESSGCRTATQSATVSDMLSMAGEIGGDSPTPGSGGGGGGARSPYLSATGDCGFVNMSEASTDSPQTGGVGSDPIAGGGGSVGGALPAPQTVTVPEGETETVTVSGGEEYLNTTVDVSAEGAAFELAAEGDGWSIAHLAVVGENSTPDGRALTLSGTGTLDTVWLGDGAADGATAIALPASHDGAITIRDVYIAGFKHGIWAADSGNPAGTMLVPGAGGTVTIESTYAESIADVAYQIGTTGSSITDAVAKTAARCFWGRWQDTEMTNCHASGTECFIVGNLTDPKRPATITAEGCQAACATTKKGSGSFDGTLGESPVLEPPEGVPTSATEAIDSEAGSP